MHLVIYKLSASLQLTKYQLNLTMARLSKGVRVWVLRSLLQIVVEHWPLRNTDTGFALGLSLLRQKNNGFH